MPASATAPAARGWRAASVSLYAAGFTTAFGAHSIAANLGGYTGARHEPLLVLGVLLAVYDGAEVALKPVFGNLSDRIGPRPVLLGGLAAFAVFSAAFALAGDPALFGAARFGQGAAAAAFSPAAGALVARLNPATRQGRAFGGYGLYKSLGYAAGPLLGGVLVTAGGLRLLFAVLAVLAAVVAAGAAVTVPSVAPQPRSGQTVLGLARRLGSRGFLGSVACLAGATAALAAGVGFLPVRGAAAGLGPVVTGAAVSLLAVASAVVQPLAGRARDAGRLPDAGGMAGGLVLAAAGLGCAALLPGLAGLLPAALLAGSGIGAVTPLGFAALAASAPPGGSARPWAPPRSAASSATPAARSWSPRRPAPPPCPPGYWSWPGCSPRPALRSACWPGQPAGASRDSGAGRSPPRGSPRARLVSPRPPGVTLNLSRQR